MPVIETKGALSAQGFGEFAKTAAANWIEDCFSCFLYTGNGSTQTITNGIDLSTKGGLVWIKIRNEPFGIGESHNLVDTARGKDFRLFTNSSEAQTADVDFGNFLSNGFSLDGDNQMNLNGALIASWTFREQPKFFDIVTYTGNGANRTIAHNLGSVPGCIIVKRTDATGAWQVYHRSLANTEYLVLNSTAATATGTTRWNSTTPTSTEFSLGTDATVNANGGSYVAYLFAHDAGGFGLTGTDNVISCGSFTTDSGGAASVTLGYEPQFIITKKVDGTAQNWQMVDSMRGMFAPSAYSGLLVPNATDAEEYNVNRNPNATGFSGFWTPSSTFIYIAIRRGPMKTPTSGTSVFQPVVYTGTNVDNRLVDMNLLTDMVFVRQRDDTVLGGMVVGDRLRGDPYLLTGTTAAEVSDADSFMTPTSGVGNSWSAMNGFGVGNDATSKLNASTTSNNQIAEGFRRAPGFFDVVCYTGTGSPMTISHNLGVSPEFAFTKSRNATGDWDASVFLSGFTDNVASGFLNATNAFFQGGGDSYFYPASSTTFTRSSNVNGRTYVAYLFATCPGVSKVGSYTGTGNTLQIDCGFTGGARFVLIKRTDSTGDWYCWDSSRGIVSGNDSYLVLNSTAAEVTNTDWVDTYSAGFELSNAAGNNVNINGASYIFLSVA